MGKQQRYTDRAWRGSCVGSLLIYCLRITKVDPVYHGLLFERFLNEYRLGTADIDIDICKEKRNILINYIKHKYNAGDDVVKVVHIISFTKSMFKSSIKDFARISKQKLIFKNLTIYWQALQPKKTYMKE